VATKDNPKRRGTRHSRGAQKSRNRSPAKDDQACANTPATFLKPMDIRRLARVPYTTVLSWLMVGHPRAGILRSVDLAQTGKRHSFRVSHEDWEVFLHKLQTVREREPKRSSP